MEKRQEKGNLIAPNLDEPPLLPPTSKHRVLKRCCYREQLGTGIQNARLSIGTLVEAQQTWLLQLCPGLLGRAVYKPCNSNKTQLPFTKMDDWNCLVSLGQGALLQSGVAQFEKDFFLFAQRILVCGRYDLETTFIETDAEPRRKGDVPKQLTGQRSMRFKLYVNMLQKIHRRFIRSMRSKQYVNMLQKNPAVIIHYCTYYDIFRYVS